MIQLELYKAVHKALAGLEDTGIGVFDGALPGADVPYPFIYIADTSSVDEPIKSGRTGRIYQTVHVWHCDDGRRGDLIRIMEMIKQRCARITAAGKYGLMQTNVETRIVHDDTTQVPLLHGVVEMTYRWS